MSKEYYSDLAEAIKLILAFAQGKGQLPRLDRFLIFWLGINALCDLYGIEPEEIVDLDKLIKEYSINAPALEKPLWLLVVEQLSKLNTKTEIITQVAKRKALE
jgi:hypothetical protein